MSYIPLPTFTIMLRFCINHFLNIIFSNSGSSSCSSSGGGGGNSSSQGYTLLGGGGAGGARISLLNSIETSGFKMYSV